MAKKIELKEQNLTTWNSRIIPNDVEKLLERIRAKTMAAKDVEEEELPGDEDMAIINNTGLKKITCFISVVGTIIDSYVIAPSGIFYQFKVDMTDEYFDFDWWVFALKNYKVMVSNKHVKEKLGEFLGMENKDVKITVLNKGKSADELNEMSLNDLFNIEYPTID